MFARAGTAPVAHDEWSSPPLTQVKLAWALSALVLTALPFINDVPPWILIVLGAAIVWRYVEFARGNKLPHGALRIAFAMATFAMVWVSYGTINGLEAGTGLLIVMTAMKLTETARARDLVVIVYMAFFMIVAHALFDQNIGATLYGVLCLFVVVASLVQISRRAEPVQPRRALSRSAMLLAQALPLMLLMFVLFPRVPGPFWALPSSSSGMTGLSDTMNPGAISNLLESSAVTFRVEFDDTPPDPRVRYWRGPVLDTVVNGTWSSSKTRSGPFDVELDSESINYTLMLEPHQRHWVFALDLPALNAVPTNTRLNTDLELLSHEPVKERKRFRLRSHTQYRAAPNGLGKDTERFLDVTRTRNPRTREMARSLRERYAEDDALIRATLQHFTREPFVYTLRPPALTSASPSDEFLFETRRGFCEHYASSFALLMRYAGIPSRVVTGYQGGERNPLTGHFTVRQSDAHAWTEVWLPQRGWTRIDPTGAVAPERVESGISGALGGDEQLSPLILGNGPLLSRLRFGWDAANAAWNRHILAYGQAAQRNLLRKLGLKSTGAATLIALLTASGVAVLALLAAWLAFGGRRRQHDPVLRAWHLFCKRLERAGIGRDPHEGPADFARRVARERPELTQPVRAITDAFIRARYRTDPPANMTRDFAQQVRAFKPTRLTA